MASAASSFDDSLGQACDEDPGDPPGSTVARHIPTTEGMSETAQVSFKKSLDYMGFQPGESLLGKKIDYMFDDSPEISMQIIHRRNRCFIPQFFVYRPCCCKTGWEKSDTTASRRDIFLARLAETYLIRAEAYIKLGTKQNRSKE